MSQTSDSRVSPGRPNILLITTDQQRFDTIAATVGDPGTDAAQRHLLTPHLDWLCDTGTRYTRAYADCPVCAPSRATIMTGRHAWRNGPTANAADASPMARLPTLPGLLTRTGYQTHAHGKMHFHPPRAHYGFEHMRILPDYYRAMRRKPGCPPPLAHGLGQNEMEPALATTSAVLSSTAWVVDECIDFLETRDPTRPFFLWSSFSKPHAPFDPSLEAWALYDGLPLPAPKTAAWSAAESILARPFRGKTYRLNNVQRFSVEKLRATRRAYYACVTEVDYALGRLFGRLRELGLFDHTWIVFTSDHGEMLGDHGFGAKGVFFEGSAHVPLIVRPPGLSSERETPDLPGSGRGVADDRLVCLADILPTVLGIAGVPLPGGTGCDGLDLRGAVRRDRLFGESGDYHAVIDRDGRTFHFSSAGGGELAFDLAKDPGETSPLASAEARPLRDALVDHLGRRAHPACRDGKLIPLTPAPDPSVERRAVWSGFHTIADEDCDLLH